MSTATDPRIADRTIPTPGGIIGLEKTPYAGYRLLHELDSSWTIQQETAPATDELPAVWSSVSTGLASVTLALDDLDQRQAGQGAREASSGASDDE